ncbi:Phosphoenolpyruvate carboxylase [Klebsiella pneumoniae IS39]|nr:Phosphoenolpyruvate carboxylase [Klebsiella pneumoniae IS39]
MIRFKYGLPEVTISSLSLYTSAILEANLLPPPEPKAEWRDIMAELSDVSCKMYRGYVRENKDFVPYFRSATPEQELGKLPLGSRPAKTSSNRRRRVAARHSVDLRLDPEPPDAAGLAGRWRCAAEGGRRWKTE